VLVVRQSELAKATPTETEALARRLAATNPISYSVALALAVVTRNGGREMAGGPRIVAALSSLAICLQNAMDNLHSDPRLVRHVGMHCLIRKYLVFFSLRSKHY
jgi:hypothetical protein